MELKPRRNPELGKPEVSVSGADLLKGYEDWFKKPKKTLPEEKEDMALPILPLVSAGLQVAKPILDALFPDPEKRARAELALQQAEREGKLKELEVAMSAIIMEARSGDKWTSRARPAFLYVIYIYILAAIPMGFVFAVDPTIAANITTGVAAWLKAVPEPMWWLFGAGYLGYNGARSFDKKTFAQGFKKD